MLIDPTKVVIEKPQKINIFKKLLNIVKSSTMTFMDNITPSIDTLHDHIQLNCGRSRNKVNLKLLLRLEYNSEVRVSVTLNMPQESPYVRIRIT